MRPLLSLALILTVSACGEPKMWARNGSTAGSHQQMAKCEYEAAKAAPLSSGGAIELAFARLEIERMCMNSEGYYLTRMATR